ncbi:MAG: apolipoprotein N-acyltransferase [Candidatus Eisenbacteria bacterium]|uniref:Apolipoprotein N-acyltransferase n=1 Tax=Eiseniibacteriota bacterium TaxID=2212470 RepID=A0A849SMJ4_UNCEI|nr:apolipoprotein N-acyltransferase [Candidatus Eisenbacteria bacterium]
MLAGAALGVAFLTPALGGLVCVGFVPLLAALGQAARGPRPVRRAFGLGWLTGLVFYAIGAHWLLSLNEVAITVPWLKYPGWLLAAAYLGLFAGGASAAAVALHRRSGAPLAVTFALAWLIGEELRGAGDLGFPWFQPGYALADFTPLIQLASLGSVTLLTLWVVAINGVIHRALESWPERPRRLAPLVTLALMIALPLAWGSAVLRARLPERKARERVALVQPNIPGEIKWGGQHADEILAKLARLTEQATAATPRPVVAIWPETATGSYLRRRLDQSLFVSRLAQQVGVPIFSGFPEARLGRDGAPLYENAAGMFPGDGELPETYAKQHLVPFGERMPYEHLVPALRNVQLGQAEWSRGTRWTLFPTAAGPFACLICFESIFPGHARRFVRSGATWLVNITNDEWFGPGAALTQHAAMACFRAVEHHVPLARVANTGLTRMIDANGRVVATLEPWQEGVLDVALPPAGPTTWYTRLGDWPGLLAALGIALLVARSFARRRSEAVVRD